MLGSTGLKVENEPTHFSIDSNNSLALRGLEKAFLLSYRASRLLSRAAPDLGPLSLIIRPALSISVSDLNLIPF